MDNLKIRGFLSKRDGSTGSTYNFDLFPLMKDFSFYDFCYECRQMDYDLVKDHGGLLVITDKQYIVTHNSSFGLGTHMGAGARIYKDLHGGGEILTDQEAISLFAKCSNEYVTARFLYEYVGEDGYHRPIFQGYIHFDLIRMGKNKEITEGMFNNFAQFYEDYAEEIKLVNKKYGLVVSFCHRDEKGRTIRDESPNLDNVYNYLKTRVNKNIETDDNEVIIGKSSSKTNHR